MKYLNPVEWLRWIGQFTSLWFLSMPWVRVSSALPAMILAVAMLGGGVLAVSEGSGWRDGLLEKQLIDAWSRDDFKTSELLVRRQLAQDPNDNQAIHQLALTLNAQDDKTRAADLMRQLVEIKEHAPSARWLLSAIYGGREWPSFSDEEREEFGNLLRVIHQESPDDLVIKQMYANYLIADEKYAVAVKLLEELSVMQPMRGLQAAAIYRQLGNNPAADRLANQTLDAVDKMSKEDPTNSALAIAVAQNQLFLGRYREAVETLARAVKRARSTEDKSRLSQWMGDSIVAWVNFIEQSPNTTVNEKLRVLKMLQTALNYAPTNPRVLALVADHVLATAKSDDEEITAVRKALIEGSSPGIAHFIQGTAALIDDDIESATVHLKLAQDLLPRSSAILNNLAVALTSGTDEHLEQALKLSQSAVENVQRPAPHFYETRGQILRRLGRHLEAIPDLERALSHPQLAPKAHESLAECYAAIGKDDLSRRHREAAKSKGGAIDEPREVSGDAVDATSSGPRE